MMASRASLNTMKKICTLKTSVMAAMCSAGLPGFVLFAWETKRKQKGQNENKTERRDLQRSIFLCRNQLTKNCWQPERKETKIYTHPSAKAPEPESTAVNSPWRINSDRALSLHPQQDSTVAVSTHILSFCLSPGLFSLFPLYSGNFADNVDQKMVCPRFSSPCFLCPADLSWCATAVTTTAGAAGAAGRASPRGPLLPFSPQLSASGRPINPPHACATAQSRTTGQQSF